MTSSRGREDDFEFSGPLSVRIHVIPPIIVQRNDINSKRLSKAKQQAVERMSEGRSQTKELFINARFAESVPYLCGSAFIIASISLADLKFGPVVSIPGAFAS
jgi:hypothetical protein